MTEPEAAPTPTPPELLARAMEHLSSEERQQVTAWFLARSTSATALYGRRTHQELLQTLVPGPEAFRELYGRGSTANRGQQVVPVRLPADLHARLRLWCTEHGFSMATVVRGLVARFLDSQAPITEPDIEPVESVESVVEPERPAS
jgi:hypothetical protein